MEVIEYLKNKNEKFWWIVLMIGLVLILGMKALTMAPSLPEKGDPPTPEGIDTMIPPGFVLVPLEIQNFESLDSILGQTGVVDLFFQGTRVAKHIKILRAPLDPTRFAVLAHENEAPPLVRHSGPFLAIVQNPKQSGRIVLPQKQKPLNRIFMGVTK